MPHSDSYSNEQLNTLIIINIIGSCLSLIGASFIQFNFIAFKDLRLFAFKLILCVSIGDSITAISGLFGNPSTGTFGCYLQSILFEIGILTSLFYVSAVSFTIRYILTSVEKHTKLILSDIHLLFRNINIAVCSSTLILSLLPFTTDSYGNSGGWCWIKGDSIGDRTMRYITFYIPLWIAISYMIVVYFLTWAKMNMIQKSEGEILESTPEQKAEEKQNVSHAMSTEYESSIQNDGIQSASTIEELNNSQSTSSSSSSSSGLQSKSSTLNRMKYYPMVLLFCYSFATIRRLVELFSGINAPFSLALLHILCLTPIGAINAIVYGFTANVIERDKIYFADCWSNFCAQFCRSSHSDFEHQSTTEQQ